MVEPVNWLFVGRISPNKKQEDVISAFAYYQRTFRRRSQLFLAGSDAGMESYSGRLHLLAKQLGSSDIHFVGKVPCDELLKHYEQSTVFVCLSEHEGFCIPLVEAMRLGIPIVAYAQSAVAETLDGSGVLLQEKSPEIVAGTVESLVTDLAFRRAVVHKQYARLKDFEPEKTRRQMREFVRTFHVQPRRSLQGKKRTRIACATLRYYPHIGGTEVVLQNVLERLARDNFECTVYATNARSVEEIFCSTPGPETEEWINGVRVIRSRITDPPKKAWLTNQLDRLSVYGHGAWSFGQFRHLFKDPYDILHSTPFPSTHNYCAYLAARFRRKPFTCSPHLHIADAYHSDRRSLFALMRGAAAVLALTTYERDFCFGHGVPACKIHVTGVGIDPNLPRTGANLSALVSEVPNFAEAKKFLFLGRKDPGKGIPDILDALRLLRLRQPQVLFVCVGPETTYSQKLWSEIPKSLQRHLCVLGPVTEAEKHALLASSEALILMSTTESFGMVFLEAWLHGKPVIGARAGALQNVIEDGTDGFLVEPGNYVELAAAMELLLENPPVGHALGASGKAKTLQQFSWDRVAEEWARIFWEILN